MAKQSKTLNRFDSGIVEGPNPRDIADEASVNLEGLDPITIGGLRPLGHFSDCEIPNYGTAFAPGLVNQIALSDPGESMTVYPQNTLAESIRKEGHGYGLFQFTSDDSGLGNVSIRLDSNGGLDASSWQTADAGYIVTIGSGVNSFNYSISSSARGAEGESRQTLYTLVAVNTRYLTTSANYYANKSCGLFLHAYSLADNGTTDNHWYRLRQQADDGVFDFSNLTNSPNTNLNPRPKFYMVGGTVRVYGENISPHYIGYKKRGFDIYQGNWSYYDGHQPDLFRCDRWWVSTNDLKAFGAKKVAHRDGTSDIEAFSAGLHNFNEFRHGVDDFDAVEFGGLFSHCASTGSTYAEGAAGMSIQWVPDNLSGGWLSSAGPINFHAARVYDGDIGQAQQGPMSSMTTTWHPDATATSNSPTTNCKLRIVTGYNANPSAHMDSSKQAAFNGDVFSPRCTGYRVYYSYLDAQTTGTEGVVDTNIYLLYEVDFDKGTRLSGSNSWITPDSSDSYQKNYRGIDYTFVDPPILEDFVTLNKYSHGQSTNLHEYKTAVHTKGRTFVGNYTLPNAQRYPDRIIKSPVDQPDIFPENSYIDLTGSDGDEIVHLETYKDDLLVFKKRTLFVVDIAELDGEKIKEEYPLSGITSYLHCQKTPHGIVYVNSSGCFLYNGSEVKNLLLEEGVDKISDERWKEETNWFNQSYDSGKVELLYSFEKDKILVNLNLHAKKNKAGDALIYHFPTKSWTIGRGILPQSKGSDSHYCTNSIIDYNNKVLTFGLDPLSIKNEFDWDTTNVTDSSVPQESYELKGFTWDEALTTDDKFIGTNELVWASKDFTFDALGSKKSVSKVYLTYRTTGVENSYSGIKVQYSCDGDIDNKQDFSSSSKYKDKSGSQIGYHKDSGLYNTNEKFRTIELIPENKLNCKKVSSFQLHLNNGNQTVNKRKLNIDDFTIIYRMHTTK